MSKIDDFKPSAEDEARKQAWDELIAMFDRRRRASPDMMDEGWEAAYGLALVVRDMQAHIDALERRAGFGL